MKILELPSSRLFIVPGNHDVNRGIYRKSDIPRYNNVKDLNDELEKVYHREELLKGMEDYFRFIRDNYPHLKSRHGDLVPFVHLLESRCEKKIGLVFETIIRQNEAVNQAHVAQEPVLTYDKRSKGAEDYSKFTREFIQWLR